jgi:hypothetical protein
MSKKLPRYPIYIPSKGRWNRCYTAKFLKKDGVPFRLVVEEQEADFYAREHGKENLLILPFRDRGSVIPARNWIKYHSIDEGHERHWQFDDNIKRIIRFYRGKRINCAADVAIRAVEDFTDRYKNIAVAGMNYRAFAASAIPPFFLNAHVYSATLFMNSLPNEWRGTYNEDTDMCLQVLSAGYCTVNVNVFLIEKMETMTMTGGNTDEIYHGDGRAKMARELQRRWPHVATVTKRYGRPQHKINGEWRKFDTPLILKDGVKIDPEVDEYGMKMKKNRQIKSEKIKRLYDQANENPMKEK